MSNVKICFKGMVHFKKKKNKKKLLFTQPHVIQDFHVFLSSVEKKLRFLMKTFQDFLHNGLQWEPKVQGPNESCSAASKGFKRHQMMNKGLI